MCDGCIEEYLEGEGRTGFTPEELAPYTLVVLTWPSWTVLLWTAVWVVALFLGALLWDEAP